MRHLLIIVVCLVHNFGYSQELNWIYKVGGVGMEFGNGIVTDFENNIIDITSFTGQASVSVTSTLISRGAEDIILRKSNRLGLMLWAIQIGSKKQDLAYGLTTDSNGNIYISGVYSDSLFVNNKFLIKGPTDRNASFIIKLNPEGVPIWTKSLESTIGVEARSLFVTTSDSLLITGHFQGDTNFESGPSPVTIGSSGGNDIFVMKLSTSNGATKWVRRLGGVDQDYSYDIVSDNQNNIYITGDFRQLVDFNPENGVFNVMSKGLNDGYILKLTSHGFFIWVKPLGSNSIDVSQSMALDNQQNVLVVGRFSETVAFGPMGNQILTSKGGQDAFVVKITKDGATLWANSYGNTQQDNANAVSTNENDIVFIAGNYRTTVDFNLHPQITNQSISHGGADNFILTLNQDGTYNDHFTFGGIANDQINDITTTSSGEIISSGGFGAIVDFDPSDIESNILSSGGIDGFILSTSDCINPYIKKLTIESPVLCHGERTFIRIEEGYLNGATQWSWSRDSCNALAFAAGNFIEQKYTRDQTIYVKGTGGCVNTLSCTDISVDVFTDTLQYFYRDLCQGDTLYVGQSNYSSTGVFIDSLLSTSGCDSVVITEITLYPSFNKVNTYNICPGDTIRVGNSNYALPGNFTDVFQTVNGCDSTIISIINLKPTIITRSEVTICSGDSIKVGRLFYKSEGTFIQSSINDNGCEDVLIVKVNVVPTTYYKVETLCDGDLYRVGSNTYFKTGVYRDTFVSVGGCDSIIVADLIFLKNTSTNVFYDLCNGDSLKIGESIYLTGGTFVDTLTRRNGCDSVVITKVTLLSVPTPRTINYDICEGNKIRVGSREYGDAGTYLDTLASANGCDSIVKSIIIVTPKFYKRSLTICEGDTAFIGGTPYISTGIFDQNFKNSKGCDSVVVLDLKVLPMVRKAFTFMICPGDTLRVNNFVFVTDGTYNDTLQTQEGCDSIITHRIKFDHISKNLFFNICDGETVIVNQIDYTEAGLFRDTLQRTNGCDSILNILIVIKPAYDLDTLYEICKGEGILVGSSMYFNAGKYTEFLTTIEGCDSIVNFEIKVINFVPSFTLKADTLVSFAIVGADYQWFECINGEPVMILGADKNTLRISKSGLYALEITFKGCTYISTCQSIIISSTTDESLETTTLSPNPTSGQVRYETEMQGEVYIRDILGRVVHKFAHSGGVSTIDISSFKSGTYIFQTLWNGKLYQWICIKT